MATGFKKGDQVEVSSNEDGFRGAWFRGTVVKKLGNGYQVEYQDLLDDMDDTQHLKEKIDLAHLRPVPPVMERNSYELSEEVDAYDNDGWWVGIVCGLPKSSDNGNYSVYFTHTKERMDFPLGKLRPHQEFIAGMWIDASKTVLNIWPEKISDSENINDITVPYILPQIGEAEKQPPLDSSPCIENDKTPEKKTPKSTGSTSLQLEKKNSDMNNQIDTANAEGQIESVSKGKKSSSRAAKIKAASKLKPPVQNKVVPPVETLKVMNEVSEKQEGHNENVDLDADKNATKQEFAAVESKIGKQKSSRKRVNQTGNGSTSKKRPKTAQESPNVESIAILTNETQADNKDAVFPSTDNHITKEQTNTLSELLPGLDNMYKLGSSSGSLPTTDMNKNGVPSKSVEINEKLYTFTIPHLGNVKRDGDLLQGKTSLKNLRLAAYHSVLQALFLQGTHNWKQELFLTNLREALNISNEEHAVELLRVTNGRYD